MCFAALGAIGPILSAVGSIAGAMVSAAGAQQQAQAQAQAAAYQAAVARNNQTAEAYKGAEKAQDIAIKGDYLKAQQRTAYAAAGVSVDTGTPVTVFGISAGRIEGDVANAQFEGKVNAARWADQAKLYDLEAQNAAKAGQIASMGAIIGGVTGGMSALTRGAGSSGSGIPLWQSG